MSKRGQVTLFIVIGLIILGVVGFLILLSSEKSPQEIPVVLETSAITSYVEECLYSTTEKAILENGISGGYFLLPEHSTTDFFENVPYFDLQSFPSDEIIADEVGKYVDVMLDFCLDDFEVFGEL